MGILPRRLRDLRQQRPGVFVADGRLARLRGLIGLNGLPEGAALLLPRCSSVHTFGMRFAIDVAFLDEHGEVIAERRGVRPWRIVRCPGAASALERQAEPTSAVSR